MEVKQIERGAELSAHSVKRIMNFDVRRSIFEFLSFFLSSTVPMNKSCMETAICDFPASDFATGKKNDMYPSV